MARKRDKDKAEPQRAADGMFSGMVVFLVERGIQPRRLQVWKQKLQQLGAEISSQVSRRVTHVFSLNSKTLVEQVGEKHLKKLRKLVLSYQWLEDCLKAGYKMPEEQYYLESSFAEVSSSQDSVAKSVDENHRQLSDDDSDRTAQGKEPSCKSEVKYQGNLQKQKQSFPMGDNIYLREQSQLSDACLPSSPCNDKKLKSIDTNCRLTSQDSAHNHLQNKALVSDHQTSGNPGDKVQLSSYVPPNLNKNITEPFRKLQSIYKDGLGDDRRAFSYHKVISVLEKLPFKIESIDQVKGLPGIGKSMQDHIQEILQTGRLSKLEHFERDGKICTISLFGEVWGIGPATASKLYEKGHRTLEDLKRDNSLTQAQKIGLDYFDDLKKKIPRNEVEDMESLLQKEAQKLVPGIMVICGGSYRRGKALCGDMDFVVTHPDGKSHKGFLVKFVESLKEINFLKEDLIFSIHSIEGDNSSVDTYFGLCSYPGREQRHRIDIKVYPREIYAFGLLAWTGNDVLNRRLRLLADEKGYRLDDTGLFPVTQDSSGKKVSMTASSVPCKTEKDIFDFLGFPWLEPHERNL